MPNSRQFPENRQIIYNFVVEFGYRTGAQNEYHIPHYSHCLPPLGFIQDHRESVGHPAKRKRRRQRDIRLSVSINGSRLKGFGFSPEPFSFQMDTPHHPPPEADSIIPILKLPKTAP